MTGSFIQKFLPIIINYVVVVEKKELKGLCWSFCYFFFLLCSYYLLRPVRDEMGIQAGLENLRWLFTATFLVMLVAVPIFGIITSRYPRKIFLPYVYVFFASTLIVFYILFLTVSERSLIASSFFVWLSVFNLFVVSVFWSFMSDIYRDEQARRLFGFISAGGSIGALTGPLITITLADMVEPEAFLFISSIILLGAVICINKLSRLSRDTSGKRSNDNDTTIGGNPLEGIALFSRSTYLTGIGFFILVFTILSTFLYFFQANIVSGEFADPNLRTKLFAKIDFFVNLTTISLQLFVVGKIIKRYGITFALILLPVITILGFLLLGLYPTLVVLVIFGTIRRAGEYAITKPAREMLYTVLTRKEKYKAKNFIDTVVYRAGDAFSGWFFEGLRFLGFGLVGIAFIAIPLASLWFLIGLFLGKRQEKLSNLYLERGQENGRLK